MTASEHPKSLNRPISVTDAAGQSLSYGYDEVGNKLTETDRRGTLSRYRYDGLNRELDYEVAGTRVRTSEYDLGGYRRYAVTSNPAGWSASLITTPKAT